MSAHLLSNYVLIAGTTVALGLGQSATSWQLGSLRLNLASSSPDHEFASVVNTLLLSDGRIVVANGGSQELRFFDRQGALVQRVGRAGSGPGEFRRIGRMFRYVADSIGVFDASLRRVTIVGPSGSIGRTIAVTRPTGVTGMGGATVVGAFRDGSLLSFAAPPPRPTGAQGNLYSLTATWFQHGPNGEFRKQLGETPGGELYLEMIDGNVVNWEPPFRRELRVAVAGNRLYAGDGRESRIVALQTSGRDSIAWSTENLAVTPQDVARYREERLASAPSPAHQEQLRRSFDRTPAPSSLPAFGELLSDDAEHLWVQDYRRPGQSQVRWRVLRANGQLLASFSVPVNLRLQDVRGREAVGVWVDDLGVETVRLYEIRQ